ncbi:MAG: hypothetical protein K2P81_05310 [Bacteriovoracaceae bacterium]|nr:hypothetical protein [Bacteriovoracaceae bacterium]
MKRLVLGLLALSTAAQAAELKTHLSDVIITQGEEEVLVLAQEEGRVLRVNAADASLVESLKIAKENHELVMLDIDLETTEILGAQLLETETLDLFNEKALNDSFIPTVLSLDSATSLFNRMDTRTKRFSQCFNRAHGWAYDMFRLANVNSKKVFIFFTQKFIKEHKYKWWFHVSPYVMTQEGNMTVERVMDVSFTRGPTFMQEWTDTFMPDGTVCPTVARYTDYRNNQWAQDCYLIKASMFYRSPMDLELLEKEGRQELGWNYDEIREARKQAFKDWQDYQY